MNRTISCFRAFLLAGLCTAIAPAVARAQDQTVTLEIRAEKWRGDSLVAEEERPLSMRQYLRDELLLMLDRAVFASVVVRGDYSDAEPTADNAFLTYIAGR